MQSLSGPTFGQKSFISQAYPRFGMDQQPGTPPNQMIQPPQAAPGAPRRNRGHQLAHNVNNEGLRRRLFQDQPAQQPPAQPAQQLLQPANSVTSSTTQFNLPDNLSFN